MATKKFPRSPRIRVDVTEELIRTAVTADSSHCMIAEAVRKAFPPAQQVSVDVQTIRLSDPRRRLRYVYLTPRTAQIPIIQFDEGIMPKAFQFTLHGAHVTHMEIREGKRSQSDAAKSASKGNLRKAKASQQALARARLVDRAGRTAVMTAKGLAIKASPQIERVGGKEPPTTAFGNIRRFGLRALSRASLEPEKVEEIQKS